MPYAAMKVSTVELQAIKLEAANRGLTVSNLMREYKGLPLYRENGWKAQAKRAKAEKFRAVRGSQTLTQENNDDTSHAESIVGR